MWKGARGGHGFIANLRCAPFHVVQLEEFTSDATNSLAEGSGAAIHLRSVAELHASEWGRAALPGWAFIFQSVTPMSSN